MLGLIGLLAGCVDAVPLDTRSQDQKDNDPFLDHSKRDTIFGEGGLNLFSSKGGNNNQLTQFEQKLTKGMLSQGYSLDFAQRLFKQIQGFGVYGFPESHSASFALLAYVSAWLKCHYPAAYCCAIMNSQPMGFYSSSQLIQDAQRHNIHVSPIDVNYSEWDHTLCLSLIHI